MRKKILFISHNFQPVIGGTEVISEVLATAFSNAGFDVHLLTWTTSVADFSFPFSIISNPSLKMLIKEHRWADLVFENNPTLRLSWPSIFFGKPLVIALHSWMPIPYKKVRLQEFMKKLWLKRANRVVAVSNALREKSWPNATVIPNPYRFSLFKRLPEIYKNRDFVILGRLVQGKGTNLALHAIHKLTQAGVKTNLTIIGAGPEHENLLQLVSHLNLSREIVFTDALRGQNLVKSLNQHRFILVPSTFPETFGMVALEGMACGCIPITSDIGGLPEAIGEAGLTFKSGNTDALAKQMKKLISNPDLIKQLRDKSRSHLQNHKEFVITERYVQVINNTLLKM